MRGYKRIVYYLGRTKFSAGYQPYSSGQQLVLREHVADEAMDEAQGQVPPFTASSSTTSNSTTQYRRVLRVWAPSQSGLALLGPSVAHWY